MEIQGVQKSIEEVFEDKKIKAIIEADETLRIWHNLMQKLFTYFAELKTVSGLTDKEQIKILKQMLHSYFRGKEVQEEANFKINLNKIHVLLQLSNSPVLFMKKMAEMYALDFWDIYNEFDEQYGLSRCAEDILEMSADNFWIIKKTTAEFLKADAHQMLLYWNKDESLDEEIQTWCVEMQGKYAELMSQDFTANNKGNLNYIVDLLVFIQRTYYNVYAFKNFFEETLNNLTDKRYIVFWQLVGSLAYSKEYQEIGSVIFESMQDGGSSRRLIDSWDFIPDDLKNNKARQQLKDLMAISANADLRMKVFGF